MTDANLVLGRLIPEYFPHIFGENENEPLDVSASKKAFQHLVDEVIYLLCCINTKKM